MLVLTLQANGYEVVCPVDAVAALEMTKSESFDLLLLDTWMPGLSGTELTLEIRKTNQTTPILFYSGAATPSEIESAFTAGAQGYLVKPQGIEHLTTEIAKLIGQR